MCAVVRNDVAEVWENCRMMLSQHFAAESGDMLRPPSDEELRSDTEDCLRLLLDLQKAYARTARSNLQRME